MMWHLGKACFPALAIAVLGICVPALARTAPPTALAPMPLPTAHDRVLVIAPHPDDESLCCAGYLQRAVAAGAQVGVVWVTSGDGFELDAIVVERTLRPKGPRLRQLGEQRMQEARAAGRVLKIPETNEFFLGYPDRGVMSLLTTNYDTPYRSAYTGLTASAYPGVVSPDHSYIGRNLERDLAWVLERFQPTVVLAASPDDRHPDHAASGALARQLFTGGRHAVLYYWQVHDLHWPRPEAYLPQTALAPPPSATRRPWLSLSLTQAERATKLSALRQHRSQMALTRPFMLAFDRANEIFWPAAAEPAIRRGSGPARPTPPSPAAPAGR
jgi:LmbE family N-acetylglucosaminyl deacetylase